ncbi:hypothetical protein VI817_010557 [Penicillium citrinum]|nr:hypothetical protein VI817_010557 [Penicillium citrinum]
MYLLTALVLIVLFAGYLLLNKRKGGALRPLPFKTVLVSMLSFTGSQICIGIYNIMSIGRFHFSNKTYSIPELISEALMLFAVNLLFYAFFEMILIYGEQIIGKSNFWPRMRIVHWMLLGLFVVLSILEWCWYVYQMVSGIKSVQTLGRASPDPYWVWTQIIASRWIVFWVGSWEVLGLFLIMGIQMSTRTSHIRMSTFLAVMSTSLFFGLNCLWAVWSINSYLASAVPPNDVAIAVREIIQFPFVTGTYLGLGLCFWRFPLQVVIDLDDNSDSAVKFTRSTGPVEADSRKILPEADTAREIIEADGSRAVLEADGSNPILEADSTTLYTTSGSSRRRC